MSTPTALDFALAYPAPIPATVAREFEMLSDEDRIGAVTMAKRVKATVKNFNKTPHSALAFLALKPWRRLSDGRVG
jgi:hypothetical protein